MAFAETANLAVKLTLGGNFTSQMSKAQRSLAGFDKSASRAYKAGTQIGTGIKRGAVIAASGIGILATQVGFGLDQLIQLESLTAQTNAVLKSTKGVAGQTAESIRSLAEEMEGLNAQVDDKAIQNAENVLLTFTKVGGKVFKPALTAALDLSTALGTDLQGNVIRVGKALSDPVKGITALTRAGVVFSAKQQKRIKDLVKEGKVYEAQKIILRELNKEFGGSFLAGGQTTAGKVAKFGDAIEDLQKSLAVALLPAVSNIADALTDLLQDPEVIEGTKELGRQIGLIFSKDNIKRGVDALREGASFFKSIVGPIAEVVGTAVKAFTSLPPEVQKLLVGGFAVNKLTGGLVTNVAGGIIETLGRGLVGGIKAPLVNVQGGVVNVGGGLPGGRGGPDIPGIAGKGLLAGALGVGAGIATVALATVSIAALGLVITKAADPEGRRSLAGRAATASGRGVPDWNNKALKELGAINEKLNRNASGSPDERGERRAIAAAEKTTTAVETMKGNVIDSIRVSADKSTNAVETMRGNLANQLTVNTSATQTGTSIVSAVTLASAGMIVGAIRAIPAPTVQVTSVNKTTTIQNRYGSTLGSRGSDGFFGNGGFGGR